MRLRLYFWKKRVSTLSYLRNWWVLPLSSGFPMEKKPESAVIGSPLGSLCWSLGRVTTTDQLLYQRYRSCRSHLHKCPPAQAKTQIVYVTLWRLEREICLLSLMAFKGHQPVNLLALQPGHTATAATPSYSTHHSTACISAPDGIFCSGKEAPNSLTFPIHRDALHSQRLC